MREVDGTGEKFAPLGQRPYGRLVYTETGQVIGILAHEKRPRPDELIATDRDAVELFRTFVSYTGRYEVAGDRVVHHVDISWNGTWTGTDLIRRVELNGDTLTLCTLPGPGSTDSRRGVSVLVWKREA
ncbi:MAG: lipocalin-like domain-containing protein [Rhodospirillaceae bacterium]|nr:lipocalin-like domain-containing protein [Rhodospirillaceae bacterium]